MIDIIKDYTTKRLDLLKLQFTEKSSLSAGIIAFLSIVLIAFSFFIILFNFGIAFLIGQSLGNVAYGFLIVAGFYFLLMLIVIFLKKKIVTSIANQVIEFLKH
ncbi:hypothetical protein [Epilithonimonas hungarica]|uniref:Holin-X, holin superfamily III n=1 Tax=Epilithonimonas hungarica TaxID=454006 RepID=A0A1G7U487_9FLAO|nr:hypothetical protein [Epilithonimonas hungarica]SDG42257.1 hypothetical protein SAMN05421825_3314 [Epilithonimonas hungarica]